MANRKVAATCLICSRPFMARARDVRVGNGKFCSHACVAKGLTRTRPESGKADRVRAHGLLNMRIRRGKVERPDKCGECGKACKPDGHHETYPGPVEWLCRSCHMKRHVKRHAIKKSA